MKFTISWLKKFLDTDATLEEILDKLIQLGLEVEEVIKQADIYKPFIVAEIISATKHPEADKLKICQVNNGKETIQIICGAPNARAGIKVVLAPIGSEIPSNKLIIKESKIRNVNSCGMLCSGKELAISDESDGILELNNKYQPGESFAKIYGLNETLIEISVTPNRGDCLGIYGIARDLAATGIGKLKQLTAKNRNGDFISPINVEIKNPEVCPKYIGRYFKGVENFPSPEWLQHILKSIGLKPISALVDITNYFTFAFGRPLHVYNADLIGEITLRKAIKGEKFTALNDKEYILSGEEFVLADQSKIVSLAGIIGEKDSGVYLDSKNIFLEIGLFDADEIAKTSRLHQIDTDAKYRFERKVDSEFLNTALDLATEMIIEICGGKISNPVIVDNHNFSKTKIEFPLNAPHKLLGIEYEKKKIESILSSLSFITKEISNDLLEITVPSWRNDIKIKEDIVEEIARIDGYDNISSLPLDISNDIYPILNSKQRNIYKIQRFAASLGLNEVVTWSFMNSNKAAHFSELKDESHLKNPISNELDYMRPSILPNLLEAVLKNQNRNLNNVGLFELGPIFRGSSLEEQMLSLTGLRSGYNNDRNIYQDFRKVDALDAKKDILNLLNEFGFDENKFQYKTDNLPNYYHPGRSASLTLGKNIIGYFGEIHPSIIKLYKLDNNAVGFELFLDNIPLQKPKYGRKGMIQISDYQAVERDFAFLVKQNIEIDQIKRLVLQADKKLIKSVNIFDIYQGKGINSDEKSIAFTVTIQASDHTLAEKEIEELSQKIIETIEKNTNAILRSA